MKGQAKQAQETQESRNVKAVLEMYAAFKANDMQTLFNRMSEDIEWSVHGPSKVSPLMGSRRGRDQVAEFFKLLEESEEIELFEPKEYIAQADKVVVVGIYKARVKATNRVVESDFVHIFTLHDAKATRFREFFDSAAALIAHKNLAL